MNIEDIAKIIPGYDPFVTADGCTFDPDRAQRAVSFFGDCLVFIEGEKAGQPFVLEPWQAAPVANIFGWYRQDGTRRYREVFMYVPRKNGKTPWAAGVVLAVMFMDHEPGAQLYSAACDREQAALIFRHASGMISREPEMDERVRIYRTYKSIEYPAENTIYRALSADAGTKHGLNVHLAVIDEVHAHPNGELIDVLTTGTASRRQPLTVYTTTADYNRPSVCNRLYQRAVRVRDGEIKDESLLPVIYEASADDDWRDPKVHAKANPNLGISVRREYFEKKCKRAQEEPSYQNTFKRLHLNIKTESDVRWLDLADWDACEGDPAVREKLAGSACFAGLDMSSTSDLTALSLFFAEWSAVLSFCWVPKETAVKRLERNRVQYLVWSEQGELELTEGNVVDQDYIRRRLNELAEIYNIRELAIDRWNTSQLQTQLDGDGFEVVPFGQGYASLSAPAKELERMVVGGRLQHFGHPVLRWCASNVMIEHDAADNIKPSKKKSTEKIDLVVSLVMAIGRAIVSQDDSGSVYDSGGIFTL